MNGNKKSYVLMSGKELMVLYQGGNIEAFNQLYAQYKSLVYGYLHKRVNKLAEVDEVFQDVFLRLHRSRYRYKSEYPFEPWLFAILRNSLVDYYRRKKKEFNDVSLDELELEPETPQVADNHNLNGLLAQNINLSKSQRSAIELRYGKDFSFEEIAKRLETSPSNVRQLISRALKKLRKLIKPEDMMG